MGGGDPIELHARGVGEWGIDGVCGIERDGFIECLIPGASKVLEVAGNQWR